MSRTSRPRVRTPRHRRPIPRPTQQPNEKPIDYVLNDMSTPNLIKVMKPPQAPEYPRFIVKDYKGGGFTRGTDPSVAANCFITIANTLKFYEQFFDKPLLRWSATRMLAVIPVAGSDLNAFYNRLSMQFFMFGHPKIGGTVFTGDSSDVVAHELGHAIFDAYRPDTWGAASMEVWAYHEAFADLTAMMNIMTHNEILHRALHQTKGNMRQPNVISRLAEHVGKAVFKFAPPTSGRNKNCLRSAINGFNYVPPNRLPKEAPHNKLAAECHSFGRIFLGAFYDILVSIYEIEKENKRPIDALKIARDELAKRVLVASQHAGLNTRFFESIAKTILWVDQTKHGGKYQELMKEVFAKRNLIRPQLRMLNAPNCDNDNNIMTTQSKLSLRLSDHIIRAQSISNPLYDVELEIPHEQMYLYDQGKNVFDAVLVSDEEAISAAQDMVDYLHVTNNVGDGQDTPFEVKDGKLVRTNFS